MKSLCSVLAASAAAAAFLLLQPRENRGIHFQRIVPTCQPAPTPTPFTFGAGEGCHSLPSILASAASLPGKIENFLISIGAEPDPERREQLLISAARAINLSDIPAVLAMLQKGSAGDSDLELSALLVRRWTENDAAAVADWVVRLPGGRIRDRALDELAIVWAGQDLRAAVHWACQLAKDDEWHRAIVNISSEAVRFAPKEAIAMAFEIPTSPARDDIIVRAAGELAATAPTDSLAWAERIKDPGLREQAIAAMAAVISERDPIGASRLAVGVLTPGRLQSQAVIGIVQRWAQTDPVQAADWVEHFPASELKGIAIENLVAIWSQTNPGQAEYWLERLRSSSTNPRDRI